MLHLLLLLLAAYGPNNQLDINRQPTLAQLRELPVDSAVAQAIFDYLQLYGRLNSIYDLMKIPGINSAKLEELKPLIRVTPIDWEAKRTENVQRLQRRLASEDGPTRAVVEEWQDLAVTPLNINRAGIDDLLMLENVSLIDAVAVARFLKSGARIESRRDLATKVDGLSSYGYRGIRNYVSFADARPTTIGGNYRVRFETDPGWTLQTTVREFDQALETIVTDSAQFRQAGYTQAELDFLRTRLEAERNYAAAMNNRSTLRQRLRLRLGENYRAGLWTIQKLYETRGLSGLKGFGQIQRVGPLRRLMLGDYRLTLGQGLLMDNNSELVPRSYQRPQGLFNDLNENPGFGLRGGAAELELDRFGLLAFYSHTSRDGILNPDSTVNYYIVTTPRYPTFQDALKETDLGGNLRLDLSDLLGFPTGTRIGVNALSLRASRSIVPDARLLDLPGDAELLDDPNWTRLDTGRTKLFLGTDFRTVIENLSAEGEYARQA
ncbi:MAG: helix-hairpin-helix domain-containing protein, partial [candidate division WOR-3 bacterium]